jgi:hypothetical protein
MIRNVQHNDVEQVHVAEYNWGEEVPSDIPIDEIDMVLAADCVYFEVSALTSFRIECTGC